MGVTPITAVESRALTSASENCTFRFLADEGPAVAGEVGVLSSPMGEETPNSDSEKAGETS